MKKFIIITLLVLFTKFSFGQLYVENMTREPIEVAFGMQYRSQNNNYWFTKGWYVLEPGQKIRLHETIGTNPNIYYYAKSTISGLVYSGKDNLLVSKNAFTIKNADMEYQKTQNNEYYWLPFIHVEMTLQKRQTNYTIEIYQQFE